MVVAPYALRRLCQICSNGETGLLSYVARPGFMIGERAAAGARPPLLTPRWRECMILVFLPFIADYDAVLP